MTRTFTALLLASALFASATAGARREDGGHFRLSGPLDALLAAGAQAAPVTSGLRFTVTLSEGGARVTPGARELSVPGAAGPLRLDFDGLKFAAGRLAGSARLTNAAGTPVEGLRLDVTGAEEEYRAKDAAGGPVLRTRAQNASLRTPLFFGDLAAGESSESLAFDAGALAFTPDTTRVTLAGVVSGLRFAGSFDVEDLNNPVAVETDPQGRVLVAGEGGGKRVVRTDADGRRPEVVATLEDQLTGMALDPKTGDIYATRGNSSEVYRATPGGAARAAFDAGDYVSYLRTDRRGSLYGSGGHVYRFSTPQPLDLKEAAGVELSAMGIDVDGDGRIWIVNGLESDRSLLRVDASGRGGRRVAAAAGWKLGSLLAARTVRVDAAGNAYVAEEGLEGEEAARVSVFDREGRFLRAFGRGGASPHPDADKVLKGQLWRPHDIAFGPGGRVYVACENDGGFSYSLMQMFQPF